MTTTISGIYRHYQGTDAECANVQIVRELCYTTDLKALRYVDCLSGVHYFYEGLPFSGALTGAGTSGTIPLWGADNTLGDSVIQQVGNNIGVEGNITGHGDFIECTPTSKDAAIQAIAGASNNSYFILGCGSETWYLKHEHNSFNFSINYNNGERLRIDTNGNLLVGGNITGQGDIYSTPWGAVDATVSGWAEGATVDIWYKKIGKLVFVNYKIKGYGNSSATTFSLPVQAASTMELATKVGACGCIYDGANSVNYLDAGILFPGSATTATVKVDAHWVNYTGDVFGSDYPKWLCGQFWYESK